MKTSIYWSCLFYILLSFKLVYADYFEVTLLGTGSPRPDISRFGPSTVVEANGRYFVFDSGRGSTIRLQQAGIPLAKIEHVFITHLHSDHISGLADLWLTGWIWQRQSALNLYGPTGIESFSQHIKQAYQADISYRIANSKLNPFAATINVTELKSDAVVYSKEGIKITAFLVDHGVVEPSFGYRLDSGQHSVVISGDTTYSANLVKYAQNTDLLIHEIMAADQQLLQNNPRLQNIAQYHSSPQQAAKVFNQVNARASVYSHLLLFGITEQQLLAQTKALYSGAVYIGHDLLKIAVGEDISIYPSPF